MEVVNGDGTRRTYRSINDAAEALGKKNDGSVHHGYERGGEFR